MKFDLSNGEVDEEVDAAVDGQAEVTHTKQPAESRNIWNSKFQESTQDIKYQIANIKFKTLQAASWKVKILKISITNYQISKDKVNATDTVALTSCRYCYWHMINPD